MIRIRTRDVLIQVIGVEAQSDLGPISLAPDASVALQARHPRFAGIPGVMPTRAKRSAERVART